MAYLCHLLREFVSFAEPLLLCLDGDNVAIENGTFSWSAAGPPCLKRYLVVTINNLSKNKDLQSNISF